MYTCSEVRKELSEAKPMLMLFRKLSRPREQCHSESKIRTKYSNRKVYRENIAPSLYLNVTSVKKYRSSPMTCLAFDHEEESFEQRKAAKIASARYSCMLMGLQQASDNADFEVREGMDDLVVLSCARKVSFYPQRSSPNSELRSCTHAATTAVPLSPDAAAVRPTGGNAGRFGRLYEPRAALSQGSAAPGRDGARGTERAGADL